LRLQHNREQELNRKTIAYARVSSRDPRADLERQKEVLEHDCAAKDWTFEVIDDLGRGINDRKPGLTRLLKSILAGEVHRLGRVDVSHWEP